MYQQFIGIDISKDSFILHYLKVMVKLNYKINLQWIEKNLMFF